MIFLVLQEGNQSIKVSAYPSSPEGKLYAICCVCTALVPAMFACLSFIQTHLFQLHF